MARDVVVPESTLTEEITSYQTYHDCVLVTISVGSWTEERTIHPDPDDSSKDYIVPPRFEKDTSFIEQTHRVEGDAHEALLSEDAPWHPGKSGNAFEKNDLWFAVDAITTGVPLEKGSPPGPPIDPPGRPENPGNPND